MSVNPILSVQILGVRETIVALQAETFGLQERAVAGLLAAGKVVEARAKRNVRPYNYRSPGRLHEAITTWVSVKSPVFVSVKVGIRGNTFAPEGKTFEVGWRSARGLQPPTAPLAEWAIKRGIASNPKEAQRVGFVIARAQGRRGYSFGERHWLSDAWAGQEPMVEATVVRYAASAWASQPRSASGRFMSL